ncbi:hypothetical protein [Burkholderia gladioli]|uniref:hypothetical protein n=1 Tax=Burkholderia gladioli TaxID=28095 RepID=UPI0016417A57|nr:hypothetical protein [Burkholderia gladioli]
MKDAIIGGLAQHGWCKDKILDFFNKPVDTFVGQATASIWLRFEEECDRWWLTAGNFTSAGENVLATSFAFFPVGISQNEIQQTIAALVASMDRDISRAFSVRMLDVVGYRPVKSWSGSALA